MLRLSFCLILWFCAFALPARADTARDLQEAMRPLEAYLEGHATGSRAAFERAFAPDAQLIGYKDGILARRSAREYIDATVGPRDAKAERERSRRIASLTVTGKVATAVVEIDYPTMKALDHMTLLEFEGGWRIVLKAYDAHTP